MSKRRKVKLGVRKADASVPRVGHTRRLQGRAGPSVHKFSGGRADAAKPDTRTEKDTEEAGKAVPKAMAARLAAMAAASAELDDEDDEIQVRSKGAPPDEAPAKPDGHAKGNGKAATKPPPPEVVAPAPKPKPEEMPEGVQLVSKGPSRFTAEDLELLRKSIKVKGGASVIEGINLDELKWDNDGLLPVVAQDRRTGAVVTVGWTNRETLEASLRSKQMGYWNRSANKPVKQGEDAGRTQRLVRMLVDCDKDTLLAHVEQDGTGCHRDTGTCFENGRALPIAGFLGELDARFSEEHKTPKPGSPTSRLLAEPVEALKGFVESANVVSRALQGKGGGKIDAAAADAIESLLLACRARGVSLERIVTDLYARAMADAVKGTS